MKNPGRKIVCQWQKMRSKDKINQLTEMIDIAIKRNCARAWEEGFQIGNHYSYDIHVNDDNPYRARKARR